MLRALRVRAALTVIFIALMGVAPAKNQTIDASPIILAYSAGSTPYPLSVLIKSPRGVTYRLSLIEDSPPGALVTDLDLVLHKPGEKATFYGNLLDPTGSAHGIQPYTFGAWDFRKGASKSVYGQTRAMTRQKLGMEVRVTIVSVHVIPTGQVIDGRPEYKFHDFTIEITTRPIST